MYELEIDSNTREFPYNNYTITLKFNEYDGYWYYDIVSDEKSMYGVPLYIDDYVFDGLDYLDMPYLLLVDSNESSAYPIDYYNDLGDRLKLIVIDNEDIEE